jgi:hydroxymethylbilane synthase
MQKIRIGTRGSRLALWQADYIEHLLRQSNNDIELERIIIKTEGDRDQSSSLTQIGGQGVFTKAIEEALLENRIDVAVHSLKDLPSAMPEGLFLAAVPERGPVEDVLVTKDGLSLNELGEGASVATGSIRRCSQLLHLRPDLDIQDLRGNIETRLNKLYQQNLDGIIMARAAIYRLELDHVKYYSFSTDEMVPGVGQGAVGVQTRADDLATNEVVRLISHQETFDAVTAERAFLNELDSGCQFPVGAYARI